MTGNGATGLTQRLVRFYHRLEYEELPAEALDRAKALCLDYLGVGLRGSTAPSAQAVARVACRLGGQGEAPVMGTPWRTSPQYAALANGTAAHSLELDDVSNEASLHPGVATFPAAFACAHWSRCTGRDFITAIVCGYDLMIRLGRALNPPAHYARGFHPTATCGPFASALVASRLLGLDGDRTTWALGIAGSQAAGSLEFLADGAWTKRLHPGWASHSGLVAASLAAEGFTGPATALEGERGFLRSYSDSAEPAKAEEGLGELFYITRVSVKPHACCRYNQGPIDCLLAIRQQLGGRYDQVDEVRVGLVAPAIPIVALPREQKQDPHNVVEAQFSLPFAAAVALVYGRAGLEEYQEGALADHRIRQLMRCVTAVEDDALDRQYPQCWPAWAEVRCKDGSTLRAQVQHPLGDPENSLAWHQLEEKFYSLTQPVISSDCQQRLIDAIWSLESCNDIRELAWLTTT